MPTITLASCLTKRNDGFRFLEHLGVHSQIIIKTGTKIEAICPWTASLDAGDVRGPLDVVGGIHECQVVGDEEEASEPLPMRFQTRKNSGI